MDTGDSATMDTDVKSLVGWEELSVCSSIEVIPEPGEIDEFVHLKADSDTSVEENIDPNPEIYITAEYRESLNDANFEAFNSLSVSSNNCNVCPEPRCVCCNGDTPSIDNIDSHTLSGSKEDKSDPVTPSLEDPELEEMAENDSFVPQPIKIECPSTNTTIDSDLNASIDSNASLGFNNPKEPAVPPGWDLIVFYPDFDLLKRLHTIDLTDEPAGNLLDAEIEDIDVNVSESLIDIVDKTDF